LLAVDDGQTRLVQRTHDCRASNPAVVMMIWLCHI